LSTRKPRDPREDLGRFGTLCRANLIEVSLDLLIFYFRESDIVRDAAGKSLSPASDIV